MKSSLAIIEEEGAALIRRVTCSEPARLVSIKTEIARRQVYNLRDGSSQPGWISFISLAQQYPELRGAIARWLGLVYRGSPDAPGALNDLRRMVDRLPEEGDRA